MGYEWLVYGIGGFCLLVQLYYCKTRHLGAKGLLFVLLAGSGILAVLGWFHLGLAFNLVNLTLSVGLGIPGLILLLFFSSFH